MPRAGSSVVLSMDYKRSLLLFSQLLRTMEQLHRWGSCVTLVGYLDSARMVRREEMHINSRIRDAVRSKRVGWSFTRLLSLLSVGKERALVEFAVSSDKFLAF